MDAPRPSLWRRIRNFLRPPRETYGSRPARPPGAAGEPPAQYGQSTDQRRHGGSGQIG